MSEQNMIVLNGNDLTIDEIVAIGVGDKQVALDPQALERCGASRKFLEDEVAAAEVEHIVGGALPPPANREWPIREIAEAH